jgi:hypothetical protein
MNFNLSEFLKEKEFEFHENRTHIILKNCPNCDGRDKLFIDKKNHLWQCFKCKGESNEETRSGNLWKFLNKVVGLDHFQIKSLIHNGEQIQYVPMELPMIELEHKSQVIHVEEAEESAVDYTLPSHFFPLDGSSESVKKFPEAYRYLISRHVVSKSIMRDFDLRYDAARKRLVFPAYFSKDKCVGYQGRDITNRWKSEHPKCPNYKCEKFGFFYFKDEREAPTHCPSCNTKIENMFYPKSINSKNFPKTEFFFNQQNVDWNKPVVIVEGPFDCINTPNSLGLLGKFLSDTQFSILRENLKSKLILFLDGDASGTESIKDIYNKLGLFIDDIEVCPLDNQDDPGSHSFQDNITKLTTCVNISEWSRIKNILYL